MILRRLMIVMSLAAVTACRNLAPDPAPVQAPVEAPAQAPVEVPISDLDLGLRRTALSDDRVPPVFVFPEEGPGGNDRLPPPYAGAPPLIPHSLDGLLPITSSDNYCVLCHQSGGTDPEDPPQVPRSHLIDFRNAPDLVRDTVAGTRWRCTACHVVQSNAPLLMENDFAQR